MAEAKGIKVIRLTAVHYQHPQLDKATTFLEDFGLVQAQRDDGLIYYRGFGVDPYIYVAEQSPSSKRAFIGGTWAVASYEDLEKAAAHPTASGIEQNKGPGGGHIVKISDPNGFAISFVYGQTLREKEDGSNVSRMVKKTEVAPNLAFEKHRIGEVKHFDRGPCPVHKVGHYGFGVPGDKFDETLSWYQSLMNVKPTDLVFRPSTGETVTCFLHIDLGKEYTDHHNIFFVKIPADKKAHVHHSSYEVNDFDTECLGHDWLASKKWTNCWGVGRHVLGSQIFDYWFDASGNIVEHYSDGDLVNEDTELIRQEEAPNSMHIWGPNVPLAFLTGKVEDLGKLAFEAPTAVPPLQS